MLSSRFTIFEFFFQLSARRDHIEHRRTRDAIRKENEIRDERKIAEEAGPTGWITWLFARVAAARSLARTTPLHLLPPTYPSRGSSLSFLSFSAALLPFLHPASDRATSRRAASPPRSTENSSSTGITHPPLTPVILRYALTIVPVSFLHDEKEGALLSFLIVETRWATKME